MTRITQGDILDALRDALTPSPHHDGAVTVPELAAALGWSPARVRVGLRVLLASGAAVSARGHRVAMDGIARWVPTYRLVPTRTP